MFLFPLFYVIREFHRFLHRGKARKINVLSQLTCNVSLCFFPVKEHNRTVENSGDQITSVLCPGLGTAVGRMPAKRSAFQMRQAYEIFALGRESPVTNPKCLSSVSKHHESMSRYS